MVRPAKVCPNCNQKLRKDGLRDGVQRWRGHAPGCQSRGRKPIGDRPMTQVEINRRYLGGLPRQVSYALFDQTRLPPGSIGYIHKTALVGVVVAPSRQQATRDRPECVAIPFGQLSKKELDWVEKECP